MSQLFLFFNALGKLSLLSILLFAVSCSSKTEPSHDHDETADTPEDSAIDEAGEQTSAEDTTVVSDSTEDGTSAVCYDEGEIVKSLALTTDLFYAGSSYQDSYGNKFVSHDSEYMLMLSDEISISEFAVSSDDVKTLVASEMPSKAGVSEVGYIDLMFKSEMSFTSTQKDFFDELSSDAQNEFLMYEFEQLFDSLAGTFELSVNGKTLYSADDKSKYSYELSDFYSVVEQSEPRSTDEMSGDQETGAEDTTDVESQGSGMSAEVSGDDTAGEADETMTDTVEDGATDTITSEDTMVDVVADDADTDTDTTDSANQIVFKFTAVVTYQVSADELMAASTFAGKTTCEIDDAGEEGEQDGSSDSKDMSAGEGSEDSQADGEATDDGDATQMSTVDSDDKQMKEDEDKKDEGEDETEDEDESGEE